MAVDKTSLSAGLIINDILTADAGVAAITQKIIPVITDEARLPYVIYRRSGLEQQPTKGMRPNDTADVEIICCAESYKASIELAEAVRAALDCKQAESNGMVMRSCIMTDASEGYQDDAYVQNLLFTIKI